MYSSQKVSLGHYFFPTIMAMNMVVTRRKKHHTDLYFKQNIFFFSFSPSPTLLNNAPRSEKEVFMNAKRDTLC